jgi:hypothetical protein
MKSCLTREVGLGDHSHGATDQAERAKLRAELDGIIANLYGLTEEEFAHVLSTFPLVKQETKDAALDAYRAFAPKPGDQEVAQLIALGESAALEFKSTARWDLRENKKSPELEHVILKTVAAFLNSDGGTLLIGVADNGAILGLAPDVQTLGRKKDLDGYELWLLGDLLLGSFGKEHSPSIRVTFHEVEGKDVCRVTLARSPRPVYIKEGNDEVLYIRSGNSTRRLNARETVAYCSERWG